MGRLHSGLAVALVIHDDDAQVPGPLHRDGRQRAQSHEHLAVAGDHQHPPRRLGQGEAEADHGRAPHSAPDVEVRLSIARRGGVPAGAAQSGYQQRVAALGEDLRHGFASIQLFRMRGHFLYFQTL